jgi:hypothetical protein
MPSPRLIGVACTVLLAAGATLDDSSTVIAGPPRQRLVIAFASLRERPAFSNLYFYRHDGIDRGELNGSVPAQFERADSHPTLTADATLCAYASKQVGGFAPLVNLWSRRENRLLPAPRINASEGSRIEPAVSGDGQWLAVCARGHQSAVGGWDVVLSEMRTGSLVALPGLNSDYDEREVAIDRAGRLLAFVTNRRDGAGLSDLALYDRSANAFVALDRLNTEQREINPSLSADGKLLAFVSDRSGGAGGKDIYVYDLSLRQIVDVPGLNSVAHEQTPTLSPDGRFVAFVSERSRGAGERDIYLYDRETSRLVPTPGLNSLHEDFDPSLSYEELDATGVVK